MSPRARAWRDTILTWVVGVWMGWFLGAWTVAR